MSAVSFIEAAVAEFRADLANVQDAVMDMQESGLKYKTILLLIQHKTKMPLSSIRAVLDAVSTMSVDYFVDEDDIS